MIKHYYSLSSSLFNQSFKYPITKNSGKIQIFLFLFFQKKNCISLMQVKLLALINSLYYETFIFYSVPPSLKIPLPQNQRLKQISSSKNKSLLIYGLFNQNTQKLNSEKQKISSKNVLKKDEDFFKKDIKNRPLYLPIFWYLTKLKTLTLHKVLSPFHFLSNNKLRMIQKLKKKFALFQGFGNALLLGGRGLRLGAYVGGKVVRLGLNTLLPFIFKNYVEKTKFYGLPQPKTFNSFSDLDGSQQIGKLLFLLDFQDIFTNSMYKKTYDIFMYPAMVKAFSPNKLSQFENININRIWEYSFFNEAFPDNVDKFQRYRHSDALFADLMVNTQGIQKAKRVKADDSKNIEFIKKHFKEVLKNNRNVIDKNGNYNSNQCLIDALIQDNNLYYVNYPQLQQIENNESIRRRVGGQKYHNITESTMKEKFDTYLELPYAIFAQVPDYYQFEGKTREKDFICLGSVFNGRPEVYHPFDNGDIIVRQKWEMAKCHIASTDNNFFIVGGHLGSLHFASGIFTTAFVNLTKEYKELKWMKEQFIDMLTPGLLSTNYSGNYTLVDLKDALFDRILYLKMPQSAALLDMAMKKDMLKFNPQNFEECFQSDAIKISKNLYSKYDDYIEYLFKKYERTWKGKQKIMGSYIFKQVKGGEFCGLSKQMLQDPTEKSVKQLMKNLAYLWCVSHGQTFSNVSVLSNFYFAPISMRKPMTALPNKEMSPVEKQQWLGPLSNIKDNSNVIKAVTYRTTKKSIISNWSELLIDPVVWTAMQRGRDNENENKQIINFSDHWDQSAMNTFTINSKRTNDGLLHLHWLQINELPHAHNI